MGLIKRQDWIVPVLSFCLAVVISIMVTPTKSLWARRAPMDPTHSGGKCQWDYDIKTAWYHREQSAIRMQREGGLVEGFVLFDGVNIKNSDLSQATPGTWTYGMKPRPDLASMGGEAENRIPALPVLGVGVTPPPNRDPLLIPRGQQGTMGTRMEFFGARTAGPDCRGRWEAHLSGEANMKVSRQRNASAATAAQGDLSGDLSYDIRDPLVVKSETKPAETTVTLNIGIEINLGIWSIGMGDNVISPGLPANPGPVRAFVEKEKRQVADSIDLEWTAAASMYTDILGHTFSNRGGASHPVGAHAEISVEHKVKKLITACEPAISPGDTDCELQIRHRVDYFQAPTGLGGTDSFEIFEFKANGKKLTVAVHTPIPADTKTNAAASALQLTVPAISDKVNRVKVSVRKENGEVKFECTPIVQRVDCIEG
jgi:hypothetical protein